MTSRTVKLRHSVQRGMGFGRSRWCVFASLGFLLGVGEAALAQTKPIPRAVPKVCATANLPQEVTVALDRHCDRPLIAPEISISSITGSSASVQMSSSDDLLLTDAYLEHDSSVGTLVLGGQHCHVPTSDSLLSSCNSVAEVPDPEPAAEIPNSPAPVDASSTAELDIDPQIIEDSPVLQRWLEEVPDVATDINHDPAFRTRVRVGYTEFPSTDNTGGIQVGVQDVFVGRTPLTFSAEYAGNGRGDRESFGIDAQYYILPLGWYGNIAPVLGYHAIDTPDVNVEGLNIGFRIILIPSRSGGADLSLTQSWVAPGTHDEIGLTTFSVGYAVSRDLRVATEIQSQNTQQRRESSVSLLLEWLL
ncbi:MAG: hypothetical protein F6K42_15875 [Leptolyngbya sp. SIO1D8]|nr:hypothetical protein [Leptolyngbya sp. SIO1D8]